MQSISIAEQGIKHFNNTVFFQLQALPALICVWNYKKPEIKVVGLKTNE